MSLSDNRSSGPSDLLPVSERKTRPMPSIRLRTPGNQPGSARGMTPASSSRLPVPPSTRSNQAPFSFPGETPPQSERRSAELMPLFTSSFPVLPKTPERRTPLLIKGDARKPALIAPVKCRRYQMLIRLGGLALLLFVLGTTLFSVSPLSREIGWNFQDSDFTGGLVKNPANIPDNVIAQATATAISHHQNDGYDPYYDAGQIHTDGSSSLVWPVGECTYWANYEYHLLTGYWVSWSGNADQWVSGAERAGWNISQTPHVPSIVVLMPYTQGASSYGHVAVVTRALSSSTVETSNMNWYTGGGGFDRVSSVDFTAGPGVYFIWHS